MKKILLIVMALVVCIGLVGAAFAYFTDTQASTGNTFTAGTLKLKLTNAGNSIGPSVTSTWVSPANWAPGQTFTATLNATNPGSIDAMHIYFSFGNSFNSDTVKPLMNMIIVSNLQERFNGVITTNQAANIANDLYTNHGVGNNDGILTLGELLSFMPGDFGYYTFDDKSGDLVILQAGDKSDYSIIFGFTFDPNADNPYQGASCGFDLTVRADQTSPTAGLVCMH